MNIMGRLGLEVINGPLDAKTLVISESGKYPVEVEFTLSSDTTMSIDLSNVIPALYNDDKYDAVAKQITIINVTGGDLIYGLHSNLEQVLVSGQYYPQITIPQGSSVDIDVDTQVIYFKRKTSVNTSFKLIIMYDLAERLS